MEFYGRMPQKTGIRWIPVSELNHIAADTPFSEVTAGVYTGDDDGEGLYWTDFSLTVPDVETFTVDIPGRNGLLDYSTVLTGSPVYKNGTLSAQFVFAGNMEKWHAKYRSLRRALHGQLCLIVLDNDSDAAYKGRCTVDSILEDATHAIFTISASIEPYSYGVSPSWWGFLWDKTDFSGDLPEPIVLDESGAKEVTISAPDGAAGGLFGSVMIFSEYPCTVSMGEFSVGATKIDERCTFTNNPYLQHHSSVTVSFTDGTAGSQIAIACKSRRLL